MVPKLLTMSSFVIPIPVSAIVNVPASASGMMSIFMSGSVDSIDESVSAI